MSKPTNERRKEQIKPERIVKEIDKISNREQEMRKVK